MDAIFNSNDFRRGKDDGFADGYNGRDMRFGRMGASMKFVIHGNKALDTYTAGYKEGYSLGSSKRLLDQTNKVNQEQQTNITTESSTVLSNYNKHSIMPPRGIDGQIELLDSMKSFLLQLTEQIEETQATNEQFIRQLDSEMIDLKILDTLEDYLSQTRSKMKDVVSIINEEEIPYVEGILKYLEESPR